MESWFSEACPVEALEAEICFQLTPHFYYGPDRLADPADLQRLVVPLSLPEIPRAAASMVRSAEAVGHEAQLAAYYEQIVRLARRHARPFNSIRHCFWLRFWLWNTGRDVHLCFPWYDSFAEIDRFIGAVSSPRPGLLDHDQDQGWEMEVHAHEGMLYIRQRDPDADETQLAVSLPRAALVARLAALRARTVLVIGHLSQALGADVWTSYVRDEPAFRVKAAWWRFGKT